MCLPTPYPAPCGRTGVLAFADISNRKTWNWLETAKEGAPEAATSTGEHHGTIYTIRETLMGSLRGRTPKGEAVHHWAISTMSERLLIVARRNLTSIIVGHTYPFR